MRKHSRLALTIAALACLVLPALAEELTTADGTTHQCEILKVEEDGVTARGKLKSGETVELKIPVARLDPHCYYSLRNAAIGDDAKARMKLAVWCVENDLFAQAKAQVKKAAQADPKLVEDLAGGKYPEIREKMAARILASAQADMAAGRLDVSRQKLEILLNRLSETQAGGEARDMIRALEGKETEASAKAEADATAKLDEDARKAADARHKLLAPIDEDLRKGRELATEGLTEDDVNKALEILGKALPNGEAALKKLDAILKDHAGDAQLQADADDLRKKTIAGMVKVLIHRCDLYIWRGSLPNAKKELDEARKLDPSNPAIDSANERILAADDDDALELRYLRERRQNGNRFPTPHARGGRGGGGGGGGRR